MTNMAHWLSILRTKAKTVAGARRGSPSLFRNAHFYVYPYLGNAAYGLLIQGYLTKCNLLPACRYQ